VINELGGWCLKSSMASPTSTNLADAYATTMNKMTNPVIEEVHWTSRVADVGFEVLSMRTKGTVAIGMAVTARDATRQNLCCHASEVRKGKFHPAQ